MKKLFVAVVLLFFILPMSAERHNYNFMSYDLNGNFFRLKSFIQKTKADYVVVDFFTINCVPCKKAIPKWEKKYPEMKKKKVEFILVVVPSEKQKAREEKPVVRNYFKKNKVSFKVLYDLSFYVAKLFKVAQQKKELTTVSVPQMFILDSDMKIITSSSSYDETVKKLKELENKVTK